MKGLNFYRVEKIFWGEFYVGRENFHECLGSRGGVGNRSVFDFIAEKYFRVKNFGGLNAERNCSAKSKGRRRGRNLFGGRLLLGHGTFNAQCAGRQER